VETETHRAALAEFRKQVKERHPQLGVETGLMALDGKLEMFQLTVWASRYYTITLQRRCA